ncbi:hypothetical protein GPALN_012772 [Globodera pallida]|nr:hypothetical protein GPALN_012772 [Globodera pallida]
MSSSSYNTNYANRNKNSTRRKTSRSPTPEDRSQKSRVKERETHDKRRNRGRRSRTSSTEEEEQQFSKMLDRKRLEKILKEKDEKRRLKESETPDEKRARRLAKKLQKEERRRTETINAFPEGIPYTDMNNPFNDTNLTETFIWKKKWESEGKGNVSTKKAEKVNREIIAKNFAEMEQLKRNRETREAAREDMEMIARDQERRQCDWNRTEDVFHLKQAKLRSSIRIKEGRAKPIDFLARYISYADESCQDVFELDNPLTYFPKDSIDDFEDLIADVLVYRVIDGQKNKFYWDDIETFAKNGLKRLLEARKRSTDTGTVHLSVQEEVLKIFKGKTYDELEQLESQIGAKISNASRGTDVTYWESLLGSLRPFMAKQRLKELHAKMLALRLKNIREEQMNQNANDSDGEDKPEIEEKKEDAIEKEKPTISDFEAKKEQKMSPEKAKNDAKQIPQEATTTIPFAIQEFFEADDEQRDQMYQQVEANNSLEHFTTVLYECGRYSPAFGSKSQTMPGIDILDVAEDVKKLDGSRLTRHKKEGAEELTAKDQRMMEIAKQGMNQDEAVFSVEEKLDKQNFLWSEKYRPRKPRYFNRVHTGFDWNKYNQTHYDIDNPPPKIVQGYRFNIFYPDLLDSAQTPTFTLVRCDVPDFSILRFCAGPPYEDIAFKIVNREWEVNYKHGYKCQFQNGIFQLWFFFKRYRYRRFVLMAGLMFLFEIAAVFQIIRKVPYTEIDWATYMQHVEVYENGQRNYTEIRGDTGPIVYPAGHLHIYRLFYHLTDHGKNIRCAQYIFGVVYLANLLLVFRLYFHSGKIPPFVLPLVCLTSYRVHSIFVLRLFNDPIAMLFFFVALNLFISRCWLFGCVFFSFAVAVKMNILLFAPALFLVLLLSNGFIETFWLLAIAALIQVLVALEFLSFDCVAYVSRAFELSRVFLFEWTVNWRFIPESVFVDRRFHIALLAAHLSLLAVFALKFWFRSSGGLFNSLRKLLFGVRLRLDAHDILFALFSSNLVGMAFARSLHYQFYCWYYHSIPYLLFSPLYSPNNQIAHIRDGKKLTFSSKQIAVRLAIMLGIEFCWNVFPSTSASSLLLHALHASVIVLSCRSPTSAHSPLKRGFVSYFGTPDMTILSNRCTVLNQVRKSLFKSFLSGHTLSPDTKVFDRETKRRQRNWAAVQDEFDQCKFVRDEFGYRIADKVFDIIRPNPVVIELGCAVGHIGPHLIGENVGCYVQCDMSETMVGMSGKASEREFPTLSMVADEESVPFRPQCCDLILSGLSAHWINDLPGWFRRCLRVLRPDGAFIGGLLAGETISELRISLQLAENERLGGIGAHISPFVQPQDIVGMMTGAGFTLTTIDVDEVTIEYPNMFALMYDLQLMGESNAAFNRSPTLKRDILVAADSIYRTMFGEENRYPATFQMISFIGWKPGPETKAKVARRGSQNVSLKDLPGIIESESKVDQNTNK